MVFIIKHKKSIPHKKSYLPAMFADGAEDERYTKKAPHQNTRASGTMVSGPPGSQRTLHHLTSPEPFGVAMVSPKPAGCSAWGSFCYRLNIPAQQPECYSLPDSPQVLEGGTRCHLSTLGRPQLSAATATTQQPRSVSFKAVV